MKVRSVTLLVMGFAMAMGGLASCGGFSTEEAEARCDQEEEARAGGGCFTSTTYQECVLAYEECGEDVVANDKCPLEFECPVD